MDGEEEHPRLVAGEFVWGKLKNRHWWPGQVHHPSSASDEAVKSRRSESESLVLVAFFGNGMLAWCESAQLKPFVAEFGSMARQSSGKRFVAAVEEALDELGRCLEVEMSGCPSEATNAGTKVARPKGMVYGLPIRDLRSPCEFFGRLRDVACDVSSSSSLLESAVLRSCVAVYWRYLGRCAPLPEWSEWEGIEEDGVEAENMARKKGPRGGSQSQQQKPKERSMAEFIANTGLDVNASAEVEEEEDELDSLVMQSKKKRRDVSGEEMNVVNAGDEEVQASGRRERKKSKYLSPPYTMVDSSCRISSRGSVSMQYEEDSETGQLPRSRPIAKCSGKKRYVFEDGSISVNELLSELRLTALNSMYLVDNESDSIIRGFFGRRRGFLYISGAEFDDYHKSLDAAACHANVKTAGIEMGLFSEEGKPGGFQIVDNLEHGEKVKSHVNHNNNDRENGVKTLGFDINVSAEVKSHGAAEGDGLIDVNVICPGFEASGPSNDNGTSGENDSDEPEITRKRKSVDLEARGSGEPRSRGRPRKKLISSENGGGEEGNSRFTVQPVLIGQVAGSLENGKTEKKRGRKNKKDETKTEMPGLPSCLLKSDPVDPRTPMLPSQSVSKPPLDFVKMSLEKMITTLNESASKRDVAESTSELKPEAKGKLVDEMSGLLMKVNKLLTTTDPTPSGGTGGVRGPT